MRATAHFRSSRCPSLAASSHVNTPQLQPCVVGHGHASLSTNVDAWHSKLVRDMRHLRPQPLQHREMPALRRQAQSHCRFAPPFNHFIPDLLR
jgi:hypothetical protein